MHKQLFSVLSSAVLFLALGTPSWAERKTTQEYWKDTGLQLADVKNILSTEHCYRDGKFFVACLQALTAGINSATQDDAHALRIVTAAQITENQKQVRLGKKSLYGAVKATLGPLTLIEYKAAEEDEDASENTSMKKWFRFKERESNEISAYFTLHAQSEKVSFGDLIDQWVDHNLSDKIAKESWVSARMLNTYLASAVDPHTHIDPREEIQEEMQRADVSFGGIGAQFKRLKGRMLITNPVKDGPAHIAGLRARDVILSIDGTILSEKDSTDSIVQRLRGPVGTQVTLTIERDGKELPSAITIKRAQIQQKNVETEISDQGRGPKIGLIKLKNFMDENGCKSIAKEIESFESKAVQGIALDLRGNGGGLLDQAVCIGGLFAGRKVIAKIKYLENGQQESRRAQTLGPKTNLPMITLIDSGSASASEILAGALQDHGRSWIAGQRSFGKATVQAPELWNSERFGSQILLYNTIARFYQPSGRTNQIVGIQPDFELDPIPNATDDDRFAIREGDTYSNALPAIGELWKQPRPEMVRQISKCVRQKNRADQRYAFQYKNGPFTPDYQALSAEDHLACAIELGLN